MAAIDCTPDKTMFGKRRGTHTATLGEFRAQGKTATEAKQALLTQIESFRPERYIIGSNAGDVFVVFRDLDGHFTYAICGKGRAFSSACLMNTTSRTDAINNARNHADSCFGGIAWEHSL